MKRLLIAFVAVLLLAGCNVSLEKQAKESALRSLKAGMVENKESVQLADVETVFLYDSLCILNFTGRIKDAFGEYASNPLEYIFYIKNGNKVGCMRSLENERSIADGYDIYSSNMDKASKDELRDKCLQLLKTEGVPAQE